MTARAVAKRVARLDQLTDSWRESSPGLSQLIDAAELVDMLSRNIGELIDAPDARPENRSAQQLAQAAHCAARALLTVVHGWHLHVPDDAAISAALRLAGTTAREVRTLGRVLRKEGEQ